MRAAALFALVVVLAAGCAGDGEEVKAPRTVTETAEATPAIASGADRLTGIPELVQEVEPSVVAVVVDEGEGSGVIWDADGIVVTNTHVVEGSENVDVVFASGRRADARVRATDPISDLAVLEVAAKSLPAAQFSKQLPRVGELALAIGNPLGFENTVTAGIVSGVHRALPPGPQTQALVDLIQTDAPISPGNSGGALIDRRGQVIGINVAYIPPETRAVSIGFAIPSSTVVDVVEQLLEDGEAEHAFLGVRPQDLTPQVVERFRVRIEVGVLVRSVVENSAAEKAGLEAGDVITSVDGKPMRKVEDLLAFLRQRAPGDEIELAVVREGEEQEQKVTVELRDRPE